MGYIWYEAPEDEKNFKTLLEMINGSEACEDDEDFQNPLPFSVFLMGFANIQSQRGTSQWEK